MRAGFQRLELRPDEFWGLTPAELRLMLGEPGGTGPLLSSGLNALMASFPDETGEKAKDDG